MTRKYRCAVYTRKSTTDGLEQDFNSLDAQRESCEAYIKSQQHEGWKLLPGKYDDGGISGGTMERPALQRLLDEVKAGRVDIIVVYKVDRLTRALSDFAKMVELFDEHDVSFVSVTQQFNTTTSMGRLTLNVLLSFAQFEREVTAERIRDKIAASKKKGMWVGGLVPLGYDSVDKRLVVNEAEAETVRALFNLYLETGNVRRVKEEADRLVLKSKIRKLKDGRPTGGGAFSRGQLYCLLSNCIYIGEVSHKGERYEGEHDAIIDRDSWRAVRAQLERNASNRKNSTNASSPSLLTGLLEDKNGTRLTPTHARKQDRRYRYYVSAPDENGKTGAEWRLPAGEIERVVIDGLASLLGDKSRLIGAVRMAGASPAMLKAFFEGAEMLAKELTDGPGPEKKSLLQKLVRRITIEQNKVQVIIRAEYLAGLAGEIDIENSDVDTGEDQNPTIDIPISFRRRAHGEKLIVPASSTPAREPDHQLIKAVALGHAWFREMRDGNFASLTELAARDDVERTDAGRFLRLAFLAPDIVKAILEGRQPRDLTFRWMKRLTDLPLSWEAQRKVLGFGL